MLISIFTALIAGSIQDVLADTLDDEYKQVPLRNSEYQVHLQVIVRDTSGGLISVTESTNGYYTAHEITDEAFNYCFGPNICKKEIVVIDNKKYEKVLFAQKYGTDTRVQEGETWQQRQRKRRDLLENHLEELFGEIKLLGDVGTWSEHRIREEKQKVTL